MTQAHRLRSTCRGCGSSACERVLELGLQPLANSLPAGPDDFEGEPRYPLDLYVCPNCFLVQLLDVVDPEVLFRDYVYVSSTSATMNAHFADYAQAVIELQDLGSEDLVVEVASNDGCLLQNFHAAGIRVLGVEPALNIAEIARGKGLDTITDFFGLATAQKVLAERGPAKAVMGNNVLAHVDDTADFLAGCRTLLDTDGVVVIEAPYLGEMLEGMEYDTIYHEHLCYFSITALLPLFERAGLSIVRVDHVPVHGGSLRIFARRRDQVTQHGATVLAQVEEEAAAGLRSMERYRRFGQDAARHREALLGLLADLVAGGARIAGYGASAKGNTQLNYCGIDHTMLAYMVDRNPLKIGRFTPGTHIPIVGLDRLAADPPDYLLILAWNFAEEIMKQESIYAEAGGKFIVPMPRPQVV